MNWLMGRSCCTIHLKPRDTQILGTLKNLNKILREMITVKRLKIAFCAFLLMLLLPLPSVSAQSEAYLYFDLTASRTERAGSYYTTEVWNATFIENDIPSNPIFFSGGYSVAASLQNLDSYAITYMLYGYNESGFWAKTIVWGTLQYNNITDGLQITVDSHKINYSLSGYWWTPNRHARAVGGGTLGIRDTEYIGSFIRIAGTCSDLRSSATISGFTGHQIYPQFADSVNLYVILRGYAYVWKDGEGWLPTEQYETHALRLKGEIDYLKIYKYGQSKEPINGYDVSFHTYAYGFLDFKFSDVWPIPFVNEVLLNTTTTLTKLDSERYYGFDFEKGDRIQMDYRAVGGETLFRVRNSTSFTFISVYSIGEISWSYLWPPSGIGSHWLVPSGRYTFSFEFGSYGDNSTVTIKLVLVNTLQSISRRHNQ